jgi:hypothetical protein
VDGYLIAASWIFWMLLGSIVGANRGRRGEGIFLTLLLGPLGLIIVAFLSPTPKELARRNFEVEQEESNLRRRTQGPPKATSGPPIGGQPV